MRLREIMNQNPRAAAGVTVAVVAVALLLIWLVSHGPATPASEAFFVDLETGALFLADRLPEQSPDGNPVARAYVFGCDSCAPEDRFLGYAQRHSAQPGHVAGHEIAEISADLERWVDRDSPEGAQLRDVRCPDDAPAQRCRP